MYQSSLRSAFRSPHAVCLITASGTGLVLTVGKAGASSLPTRRNWANHFRPDFALRHLGSHWIEVVDGRQVREPAVLRPFPLVSACLKRRRCEPRVTVVTAH